MKMSPLVHYRGIFVAVVSDDQSSIIWIAEILTDGVLYWMSTNSCVVAVGLYGNDDVHNAALRLSSALRAVNETVTTVGGQSTSLRTTLEAQSFPLAEHLTEVGLFPLPTHRIAFSFPKES